MLLSTTPFPSFVHILDAIVIKKKLFNAYFFSRGSYAIISAINAYLQLTKKTKVQVLVPDYFCAQPLHIFEAAPINITFYSVTKNLSPDWAGVKKILGNKHVDIFLLVHYFGFDNDAKKARRLCDQ